MNEVPNSVPAGKTTREVIEPETNQKFWYCLALSPANDIVKGGTNTSESFREQAENTHLGWIDYITADLEQEAPVIAAQFGFSTQLVTSFFGEQHLPYEDFDTEMGLRLPIIQVNKFEIEAQPLLILIRKNFILTLHPVTTDMRFLTLRRYSTSILRRIVASHTNSEDQITLLLARIAQENNDHNFDHLKEIEESGDALNASMSDANVPRSQLAPQIYQLKHTLITYMDSLWDTVSVLRTLRYGDADLITNEDRLLDRLNVLAEDVTHQLELAEHMSDVLASGLEVMQTLYNNQLQILNNRLALLMSYLTIIGTAVLVPNTLATVFSSSAFDLKSADLGWYITLMVVATIVATALVYWLVRRKGWLPPRVD